MTSEPREPSASLLARARSLRWPLVALVAAATGAAAVTVFPGDAALAVLALLATGSSAVAAVRSHGRNRLSWVMTTVGVALWALSVAAAGTSAGETGGWLTLRGLAVTALGVGFAVSPGVARSAREWTLLLLDGYTVTGTLVLVALNLVVAPVVLAAALAAAPWGALAALVLDIALACVLLGLARRSGPDSGAPIVVLMVAAAIALAGDLAYVLAQPTGGTSAGAVQLWAAAIAALAVLPWAGHVDIFAAAAPRRRPVAMTPLPLVFVAVALAVSAYAATAAGRTLDPLSAVIGCFVLIAPVVQLILVQRENASLYGDLATQAAGFRSMLQESNDVVMTCTLDGVVRYATPSLVHVLGYEPAQVEGTPLADLVHPDDLHAVQSRFAAVFADDQQGVSVQGRARAADGSWRHLESTVSAFREDGVVTGMILNTRDVSDRIELESKLRTRAAYDELTGLLNRTSFTDHLTRILGVESASGTFAVLFLDLDDFKSVNDTAGHAAGDDLLAVAAARVRESLRDTDIVARFGGDEFVALVSGSGTEAILEVARRLRRVLALPHVAAGREMIMAASIGVAFVSPGISADDLLRNADLAMYRAKQNGRNRYEVYAPQMHLEAVERVELARLLRHALEDQALSLHYQPIVDLDTGAVRHLEALLRWRRPDGSYIPPSEFVPVAEDCGLIGEIGSWVLRTALLQLAAWRARGMDVGVAVNLSARQLMDPDLVDAVAAALAASGVPAEALMLEITENVLVDSSDEVPKTLHALRALGVGVALDDFGTGYSSLGYLGRLPVDTLKVDRTFVAALAADADAAVLLRTMMNLGNDLGLTVVAEGVETLAELAALRGLGYSCAQGYLLARPLPPEDVEASVRAGFAATCRAGVPIRSVPQDPLIAS